MAEPAGAQSGGRGDSASDWIARVEPKPPEPLLARMKKAIDLVEQSNERSIDARLIEAASTILDGECDTEAGVQGIVTVRAVALDLLAADALITYAMEAAADNCESMSNTAESALRLFAKP